MVFRLRTLLMWVLLVALPLQGFAAATMISCGPNHHRMSGLAVAGPADMHEHSAGGQHHHETVVAADHRAPAASQDGSAGPVHHLDKLTPFKCSACAACCIGAAIPAAIVTFEPFAPAMAPDFFVPTAHVAFLTDGPDRPPRLFLV